MKFIKHCEVAGWVIFLACATTLLVAQVEARAVELKSFRIGREAEDASRQAASQPRQINLKKVASDSREDPLVGRLEIMSLGLSVPIVEGFDPSALSKGVGHIHGTAMPGGLGNMALAGHRDTFFRPLRNIRRGMVMSVFTSAGRYDYLVDSTAIVSPEQVNVVSIHNVPEMTLITCFPFDYIGSAPSRFIVTAHLESIEPASN